VIRALALALCALWLASAASAIELQEPPMLREAVARGELPPVERRVPAEPLVVSFEGYKKPGRYGGELRTLIGRAKDVRLMVVYGYARLVGYDESYRLQPDIVKSVEVEEGRRFTFRLRKGHKWSDGHPFTSADFAYWWNDVANNKALSPSGPPIDMFVDGELARFEAPDEHTVVFSWSKPNPFFLPAIAAASPLMIYRPAHYLSQFHEKYAPKEKLEAALKKARTRNWASLHNRLDNMYDFDNPDLPTLQPWMNTTRPPATRFVTERNPYYHRVDPEGRQLPYIDKVILNVADGKLIPAKAGTGEADLQARNIAFSNYTFLRDNEEAAGIRTYLWRIAKGSHVALFPNLNVQDKVWRDLFRDVRFRRALSLAIDREMINESLYFGLATESNNTVLRDSPLFREVYQKKWAYYDPDKADALLDDLGLTKRDSDGVRLLPDGRPLEIIVETAGEDVEQTDVLELIRETWAEVGVKLFIKPSQRDVFRNRVFAGEAQMAVWSGLENGLPTADMSPAELAPTSQQQLQWPMWGQWRETRGQAGEPPEGKWAIELAQLNDAWLKAKTAEEREEIWHKMLQIHADRVFTIGVVSGVQQPIVVKRTLRNLPEDGVWNWEPGAQFGVYRPDTFWFDAQG
jgi:peptide/nickel transport system substrate-binding protein